MHGLLHYIHEQHIHQIRQQRSIHGISGLGKAISKLLEGLERHERDHGKCYDIQVWHGQFHHFFRLIEIIQQRFGDE